MIVIWLVTKLLGQTIDSELDGGRKNKLGSGNLGTGGYAHEVGKTGIFVTNRSKNQGNLLPLTRSVMEIRRRFVQQKFEIRGDSLQMCTILYSVHVNNDTAVMFMYVSVFSLSPKMLIKRVKRTTYTWVDGTWQGCGVKKLREVWEQKSPRGLRTRWCWDSIN